MEEVSVTCVQGICDEKMGRVIPKEDAGVESHPSKNDGWGIRLLS